MIEQKSKWHETWWGILLIIFLGLFLFSAILKNAETPLTTNNSAIVPPSSESSDSEVVVKFSSITVLYDDLFRHNEKYIDKIVYFKGKIIQVAGSEGNDYVLRVATKAFHSGDYLEDVIIVHYTGERLLEGDLIDIWGRVEGLVTYEAVFGNEITVPSLLALHTELKQKDTAHITSSSVSSKKTYSRTQNGVTLSVVGYTFEKVSNNYGKLVSIDMTIKNMGSKTINPDLLVRVEDKENDDFTIQKEIGLDSWIGQDDSIEVQVIVDLGIAGISNPKELKVYVQNYGGIISSVSFNTNLSAGFQ